MAKHYGSVWKGHFFPFFPLFALSNPPWLIWIYFYISYNTSYMKFIKLTLCHIISLRVFKSCYGISSLRVLHALPNHSTRGSRPPCTVHFVSLCIRWSRTWITLFLDQYSSPSSDGICSLEWSKLFSCAPSKTGLKVWKTTDFPLFLLGETNFDEPAEPQTKLLHHGNREQGTGR